MAKLDPIIEFREDHRKVRDLLLDIASAVEKGDVSKARTSLGTLDTLVGPHFRYEEEALYPTLRTFLGKYVDSLISEHDGAVNTAKTAAALLAKSSLTSEEKKAAADAARALLVHVSNCDGLNILAERLSPQELDRLAQRYQESRTSGVPLIKWAYTIRGKK